MRIKRLIIETEDGVTLIAEGQSITAYEVKNSTPLKFGYDGNKPWPTYSHTGQRVIELTVTARCQYFDAKLAATTRDAKHSTASVIERLVNR